jgi:hypothetical protein
VDRHSFDADPDQNFHFDAVPDPNLDLNPTPKFYTYPLEKQQNIIKQLSIINDNSTITHID